MEKQLLKNSPNSWMKRTAPWTNMPHVQDFRLELLALFYNYPL